jgi:hypothetical protein
MADRGQQITLAKQQSSYITVAKAGGLRRQSAKQRVFTVLCSLKKIKTLIGSKGPTKTARAASS